MESKQRLTEISLRLSWVLDCMGYSCEMVNFRRDAYKRRDVTKTMLAPCEPKRYVVLTIGSRAEGLDKLYETDWDELTIPRDVLCIEAPLSVFQFPHRKVLVMKELPHRPGYVFLVPVESDAYKEFGLIAKPIPNARIAFSYVKGSTFKTSGAGGVVNLLEFDQISSLLCYCPSIITRWANRPRKYDWPSSDLRWQIQGMAANLVPIGVKGSNTEDHEWRICFNEIELLLMNSLNDTQIKLYKILRFIGKEAEKSVQNQISSYMMKNIVFWLSETYPRSMFKNDNLLLLVFKSLRMLKRSLRLFYLPYYMIEERNLLPETIEISSRRKVLRHVLELSQCGPEILFRCDSLKQVLPMTPLKLFVTGKKLEGLEKMLFMIILQEYNEHELITLFGILHACLQSEWPESVQEKLKSCQGLEELFKTLLG